MSYTIESKRETQDHTQRMIDFLIEKSRYYRCFEKELNERQRKVVERIFREGVNGFKGGLSAYNYITITGATASTATRDLQRMVEIGAFKKTGERKGTRYYLNSEPFGKLSLQRAFFSCRKIKTDSPKRL